MVATRDVLSFALVYPDSFPAESMCVSFWSATACAVRELPGKLRCLLSVPLLLRQLILCTRLCVPDSRHDMHHGSKKSHVSTTLPQKVKKLRK